jgi:hypothetical protein
VTLCVKVATTFLGALYKDFWGIVTTSVTTIEAEAFTNQTEVAHYAINLVSSR